MRPWGLRILRYALPQRASVVVLLLLTLAMVAVDTIKPWPMKLIIDNVLAGRPLPPAADWMQRLPGADSRTGLLCWLTAGTILIFLAGWAARATRSYLQAGAGARMVFDLAGDVFDHLQRLSLRFHGRRPAGDLVLRVTGDCRCVRDLALNVCLPLLTSLGSLLAMFAVMWRFDPAIAAVAMIAAPALMVLMKLFARPMTNRRYAFAEMQGGMMAMVEQTLSAMPIIQAFSRESREDQRFRSLSREATRASIRSTISELQFGMASGSTTAAGTAVIMVLGGIHVLDGRLSVGSLVVLLSYLNSLYAPMETLAWLSSGFATAAAAARRVLEVLDTACDVKDLPGARALPARRTEIEGRLSMEDVRFGYDAAHPVLKHVTLEVKPGSLVALVGPTGAGKSTLASLLIRFFDPDQGRITLDGHDIRTIQLASYRSHVAVVLQEPFLLPFTVAENIAYGRPGASRDEIIKAALAANADSFIRQLPQGYDTVLGERGATISGGERQRIAIARALLKDAPVLILDEPTAALDSRTEASVLRAMEGLMNGRTTVVIAHRLSTVQRADLIAVLDQGQIVEAGSHAELLQGGGLYHRFCQLQFGPDSNL